MKSYFITGLVLLVPFILAFILAGWMFYFLSIPFYSFYQIFFKSVLISRFLAILSVVATLIFIGFAAQYYFVKKGLEIFHRTMKRLPLIRNIYHAAHEIVTVISRTEGRGFSEPVLVAHPSPKSFIVGFIPRRDIQLTIDLKNPLIPVFIPGTVNPLMGFLIFTTKEYIKPLSISSEQAFIWNISLGGNNPF